MTRRYITLREVKQADARYRQRCLPADPGDQPGRGPGLSRARPVLPVALACGGPPRTAGARAATTPQRAAHGPIQLLCCQATRLPPGRVTRCRRARRARR